MNSLMVNNWPFQWWGYFDVQPSPQLPSLDEISDPDWKVENIERIIRYLQKSPVYIVCIGKPEIWICDICGGLVSKDNSLHLSDGTWVWPSGIEHFICRHSLVLPPKMIEHIRSRRYNLPKKITIDFNNIIKVGQEKESLDKYRHADP